MIRYSAAISARENAMQAGNAMELHGEMLQKSLVPHVIASSQPVWHVCRLAT